MDLLGSDVDDVPPAGAGAEEVAPVTDGTLVLLGELVPARADVLDSYSEKEVTESKLCSLNVGRNWKMLLTTLQEEASQNWKVTAKLLKPVPT